MSAYNWVTGALAAALIVVGFGLLGRAGLQIAGVVRLGGADRSRGGPVGGRLAALVTEILGHTRMLKWGFIGVAHWFVMVGFGALVLTLVEAVGECFYPAFELPWLGHQAWYGLFVEVIAATTVVGISTLIVVRQRTHPRRAGRRSRFAGSNFPQAYFVESVILVIGVCIFAIRGFKAANGLLPFPEWAAPVSHWLGDWLPAWLWAISVVALVKVAVSMGWAVVISQNLTMGVAWHRFTAFFNIYFKRSGKARKPALGALRPMMSNGQVLDFEKADPEVDTFGAGRVEDFSWKGWLDFTTCTECGRCQSQCPAWNTGKPLSPKLIIMDLRDHLFAKAPYIFGAKTVPDGAEPKFSDEGLEPKHHVPEAGYPRVEGSTIEQALRPLVGDAASGGVIDPDVLWSCTTCGACVEQCPVDIEHIDHIVDMRRYQVLIESAFPSEAGVMLRNIENKGNPWGMANSGRDEWMKELSFEVRRASPGERLDADIDYLFWVGCAGALEDRSRKVTVAFAELLHTAGVEFAVLGQAESCTGDPARRLGNEFLFQMQGMQNVETLNSVARYEPLKIVATCPHCFNTLANEYPQIGGNYEVVHHTQLLGRLVADGRLTPVEPVDKNVTYHDPCYLGRHNKVYTPPREVLGAIAGLKSQEMHRCKDRGFCCGAGGARFWMEEKIGKRVNMERTEEALGLDPDVISTACPFCMVMLSDAVAAKVGEGEAREDVQVLDVAQLLKQSLGTTPSKADTQAEPAT